MIMSKDLDIETKLDLLDIELEVIRKEILRLEKDMEVFADKYGITK
jgi:hypothetical protein